MLLINMYPLLNSIGSAEPATLTAAPSAVPVVVEPPAAVTQNPPAPPVVVGPVAGNKPQTFYLLAYISYFNIAMSVFFEVCVLKMLY